MSFHNGCSCSWSVPESEHFQCGSSGWSLLKLAFHRWCTWSLVSHPQTMISLCTGQTPLLHQIALKYQRLNHVSLLTTVLNFLEHMHKDELQLCLGPFLVRSMTWDPCMEKSTHYKNSDQVCKSSTTNLIMSTFLFMAKVGSEVSAFNEAPYVVPQIGLQVSDTSQCINQTPPLN